MKTPTIENNNCFEFICCCGCFERKIWLLTIIQLFSHVLRFFVYLIIYSTFILLLDCIIYNMPPVVWARETFYDRNTIIGLLKLQICMIRWSLILDEKKFLIESVHLLHSVGLCHTFKRRQKICSGLNILIFCRKIQFDCVLTSLVRFKFKGRMKFVAWIMKHILYLLIVNECFFCFLCSLTRRIDRA